MSTKTFNMSLPEQLVRDLDRRAKKDYSSRSDYIRKAVANQIRTEDRLDAIFERSHAIAKKMGITSEQQVYDIIEEYKRETVKTPRP